MASGMPSTPPPSMPPGFAGHDINNEFDVELEEAAAPAATSSSEAPSIAQLMVFMMAQQKQMAEMMFTYRAGGSHHLANAKLDDRNFKRIEKFNNKRDSWKEWRLHFTTCVRECDTSFADYIWGIEKRTDEICLLTMDPTQSQLAAALYSRLISVTTGEAFRMVEMAKGNGVEAWRLLTSATTLRRMPALRP